MNGLSGMEYSVLFSVPGVSYAVASAIAVPLGGISQSVFP